MDERKKNILTIVIGIAVLSFLTTNFFVPIAKENTKRAAQYKQLKKEVGNVGDFNKNEFDVLQKKLDTAISQLNEKFPAEGKLKLTEQLTQVPAGMNISFKEIVHRDSQEKDGYQIFPIDINLEAAFNDLIRYLVDIEKSPLMIGISNLELRRKEQAGGLLDIKVNFFGVRLTQGPPPESKYMEDKYTLPDKQRLAKLLEPVKLKDNKRVLSKIGSYDPFNSGMDFKKPNAQKVVRPDSGIENLLLKGVVHLGKEKAALINDKVVKKGESIDGMQVIEIEDYKVVLMQSGKTYILKIGGVDEIIKP